MPDRTAAERMRRMRARRAEEAELTAEWLARWARLLADQLERDQPAVARVLASLPPAVAGPLVEELSRRRFERAEARAQE